MKSEVQDRLADRIQSATGKTLKAMSCPICGGSLMAQYASKGKSALSVTCETCGWKVISDGLPAEPPWVRELGPRVQTGK